jgi:hypothetical protein
VSLPTSPHFFFTFVDSWLIAMEKHYFVGEMLLTKDFISVTNKPSEPASPFKQVVWGQCQREWWKWNHACVEYLIYDWSCIEPHHVPV